MLYQLKSRICNTLKERMLLLSWAYIFGLYVNIIRKNFTCRPPSFHRLNLRRIIKLEQGRERGGKPRKRGRVDSVREGGGTEFTTQTQREGDLEVYIRTPLMDPLEDTCNALFFYSLSLFSLPPFQEWERRIDWLNGEHRVCASVICVWKGSMVTVRKKGGRRKGSENFVGHCGQAPECECESAKRTHKNSYTSWEKPRERSSSFVLRERTKFGDTLNLAPMQWPVAQREKKFFPCAEYER